LLYAISDIGPELPQPWRGLTVSAMNIVQITPGAGGMYCGNCFRDNALVSALRGMGHSTVMVPLYLPMTLDEPDQSAGTPIFFSGINVYLEQKSPFFRKTPGWLHDVLASPSLLKWAAGKAAKTRPADLGELTLSMLRGEEGNQAREVDELLLWLKSQARPEVVCLSNALLVGLVRKIKAELQVPVVCMLQGEDTFLDALPESHREVTWKTVAERAAEADLFVAPSRYYAKLMGQRLGLGGDRVRVVYNGINLEGYSRISSYDSRGADAPVLGFFARMCREKGLDLLVDAYLILRQRDQVKNLRLRVGGGCGPSDEPFVNAQRQRLKAAGFLQDAEFFPNLDRAGKLEFLRSLTVLSTPALYGEAYGLYIIEAMAAGVPVVQPRHAAFPELLEATGGGMICEPSAEALADGIEGLLADPITARSLGEAGRKAVFSEFNVERMAENMVRVYQDVCSKKLE
jgi:glycosyltransferase involved in cell wall biosynthesis